MKELVYKYATYFNEQKGQKYPCSNQIVTCIYITDDPQEVYDYLSLNKDNIEGPIRIAIGYIEWRENNEKWIWRPVTDRCRGYRFYKVKISKNYCDEESLKYFVLPCCYPYCCSWEVME